ncbi:MAG: EAL domain-containing protein [Phycisphaerales bacterium]
MTPWKQPQNDPSDPPSAPDGMHDRLRQLVKTRNVRAAFQPIVDLQDGTIVAFEALARPGAESGFSNPGELFEHAALHGMLWPLEEVTRRVSVESANGWPANTRLFLNCTPDVVVDPRFRAEIEAMLGPESALCANQVVLEITELSDEQFVDGLHEQAMALRKLGVEIAIDDVGAGASGLNRIMLLRPQWLKLDREFIRSIDTDVFKQNMVRFFVHFAKLSCVNVIAEGVEKREELAMVASLGVRFAQGFFLARPATRAQIDDPGYAAELRDRWSTLEPVLSAVPGRATLRRMCQPATVVQSTSTIGEVAGMLLRKAGVPGVVVQCGRRFVGWCSRDRVLAEARLAGSRREISAITLVGTCTLSPEAAIHDALQLVSVREEAELLQPVVLSELGEVVGVVNVRDILDAAVLESRTAFGGRVPLTGLPGRAKADQFIDELVGHSVALQLPMDFGADSPATPVAPARSPTDAAFIDIRHFTDYNAAFGYELGDQLIRTLGDLLRDIVVQTEATFRVFHLGDDRFVVMGPPPLLEQRVRAVMSEFDRCYARSPIRGDIENLPAPLSLRVSKVIRPSGMCLRVLLVPDIASRARTHRELHRISQQLRQRSARDEAIPENQTQSVLVADTRTLESVAPVRKTA